LVDEEVGDSDGGFVVGCLDGLSVVTFLGTDEGERVRFEETTTKVGAKEGKMVEFCGKGRGIGSTGTCVGVNDNDGDGTAFVVWVVGCDEGKKLP